MTSDIFCSTSFVIRCLKRLINGNFPLCFLLSLAPPIQFVVQLLSRVWLFATPWIVVQWAPLAIKFSRQESWRGLPLPTPKDLNLFGVIQSLSCVQLFVTSWTTAHQASLSFTISWNSLKYMSIESVMPSNHLILCCPLLLWPSIFPSIRVFSNESALRIRWLKYWGFSFSFSISPSNECSGLISFSIDWFDLLAAQGLSRVFSNTTVQKHQFFGIQPSLWSKSHIHTWLLAKP